MAFISRQYSDKDLADRLLERKRDLSFEGARVTDVDLSLPTSNASRTITVTLSVPVTREDLEYILAEPID
ncbi:hypothetical protein [Microbacterium sp. NPDC087868]|uniref:hypothetical protein n=1 Tax=Microbacterium sp. NPDC087868 TaxID=3364195 RepID=UPI00384D021F